MAKETNTNTSVIKKIIDKKEEFKKKWGNVKEKLMIFG